jgi:superfamily II DNA helicase RecQ
MEKRSDHQLMFNNQSITDFVLYNQKYKVAICVICGIAIKPSPGDRRHLKDAHKSWPLKLRKEILAYLSQLDLVQTEHVVDPSPAESPIPGLKLYDGYACNKCPYYSSSSGTMQEHYRTQYKWTKAEGIQWRPAKVQTFFGGTNRRFFEVASDALEQHRQGTSIDVLINVLLQEGEKEDKEEAKLEARADEEQLPVDNTPWMRKTRWARKFAGQDLRAIAALGEIPVKDEPLLKRVCESVDRVLSWCKSSISQWHNNEEDGDLVLSWLNSPQKEKFNPESFSTYYEKSTHEKYSGYWKRLFCYCLRILHADDHHGHVFSDDERRRLNELWCHLELEQEDNQALDKGVFELSIKFWTHINTASAKSAVVHFSAVLGIDGKRGCYRQPSDYGQILAALLYCARQLLFEHALPVETRKGIENPLNAFLAIRDQWLVDGAPTPFHFINNLLAYAKGAGKDVGGRSRVQWSKDRQTIIYQGQSLALDDLRRLVQELRQEAIRILSEDLMFLSDTNEIEKICLDSLVDDMNDSTAGYSFVSEPANSLQNGRRKMLDRLRLSQKWALFIKSSPVGLTINPKAWAEYERALEAYQVLEFILWHITAGPPGRGREISTIRYINAPANMRNTFILAGQVMVVTSYHKSQAITRQHKVISRFLPSWLGQMFVAFQSEVVPFVQLMDRARIPASYRTFVWADRKGLWDTPKITKALAQETSIRLGNRITFQDYRHIAIAIDREHVRGLMGDIADEPDDVHDLGAAHSSHTANLVYGIDATMLRSLSARTVNAFREVTSRWHHFLSVDGDRKPTKSIGKKKVHKASQSGPLPEQKRLCMRVEDRCSLIEPALKRLIGPDATFRSSEQREALIAIVSGQGPLVIILPTGGGKSLLFQLPATLPGAGVTVVVVPFRALLGDLMKRCEDLEINCVHWTPEQQQRASVMLVVAEAAVSDTFLTFLSDLQVARKLDRIVIDECHVILTAIKYRRRILDLDRLRMIPCQFVLLTGTLPLYMEQEIQSAMLLGSKGDGLRYVRSRVDKPNVAYRVDVCVQGQLRSRICGLIGVARRELSANQRIVVFCGSRGVCEEMARLLQCQPYHAKWSSKDDSLASWINGKEQVIVATSALGAGVDVSGIVVVIHIDRPYSLIDFVQEVGRGGRKGEKVQSIVVIEDKQIRWLATENARDTDKSKEAMRQFLISQGCRRAQLGDFLDGGGRSCEECSGERCDICRRVQNIELASRHKASEERWSQGPQLWQERVRERALERQALEDIKVKIGDSCVVCWVVQERYTRGHKEGECSILSRALGRPYGWLRRSIRYEANSCCYTCSLPGDWCDWYVQRKKCVEKDIVVPIVLAGWVLPRIRTLLEQEVGTRELDSLLQWLGRGCRVAGSNGTNAVRAAGLVIHARLAGTGVHVILPN